VFVKVLAFAAAMKVTSEHRVLLNFDQGVLNHTVRAKGKGRFEGVGQSLKADKKEGQCMGEKT